MSAETRPAHQVVLVGGGHTHVQVMTALAAKPQAGLGLTLVTDQRETPYSGMLPGHLAGIYSHAEMHIDLAGLAERTGTALVASPAIGLDRASKHVLFADRAPLAYDTLSLNVGITPDLSRIEGAERHGVPVKPISRFLARVESLLAAAARADGPRRIAIVGGGAAGVEIAFALRARLEAGPATVHAITILSGGALLDGLNKGIRRRTLAALARHGIATRTGFRVAVVASDHVISDTGERLAADAVLISTAARAPSWLADTDLPLAHDGSIQVRPTLQVLGDEAVFAVGDCAVMVDDPRPKAGVHAVRQGPVLADNLSRRARGEPLRVHRPQRDSLVLLMTGDGSAIAGRGRWISAEGRLVWWWKDWIDRRFMQRFAG